MISPLIVKRQLENIGASFPFFGKPEIDELHKIMFDGEVIQHILNGKYEGGFAILCATNLRLLLIDKKLFFLTVEDIRYDMIAELDYGHQLIGATIHVRSFSKDLKYQCFKKQQLRDFTSFVQKRVMQQRQHHAEVNEGHVPIQTFNEYEVQPIDNGALTSQQAIGIIPITSEKWHRANPNPRPINPQVQSPLMTRKRIGRFNNAG